MVQAASQGNPSKDRPHQQPDNLTWCIKLCGKCHPNQIKRLVQASKLYQQHRVVEPTVHVLSVALLNWTDFFVESPKSFSVILKEGCSQAIHIAPCTYIP